ncbi:2,3-bisphosphoglycerate-independent phosphoglycerate mutase [Alphaproteobacteria bacterium SO-S41]|nr:2,3-bisphosphoglycerate-independent phosphoglycerate mutase [Alphaproteobacteria bacterium SO-S41]
MNAARPRPIVLCILDGWGHSDIRDANAIAQAELPTYRALWAKGPVSFLKTSGPAVGLPVGQMGNSEVGHMNIGGGRILVQDLDRIGNAIEDGTLSTNPILGDVIAKTKAAGGALHILGLLSPGGVHSHQDHIAALAKIAAASGLTVWVHPFFDGRDVPPKSALVYLKEFEALIAGTPGVRIGTASGRFYAMDRDNRWDRVGPAYEAMVVATGPRFATPEAAVTDAYAKDITDEFVEPAVIGEYAGMADGDGVVMANFRADRAREIMLTLLDPAFEGFTRSRIVRFAAAAGMSEYSKQIAALMPSLFPQQDVPNALGEVLAQAGMKQLRIAETEKYAHVTFFFNGGRETVFDGEERILIPSPKVRTYDLKPEMSAPEVTDALVAAIDAATFDVIVVNYANADQVGHTGDLGAAVKAVEAVDACLARLLAAVEKAGGVLLITADHGNAEMMTDPVTGEPHTAHTVLDVPLILANGKALKRPVTLHDGKLADLAPTILEMIGINIPADMTGRSLLGDADQQRGAA